ncbi:Cytochrome b5 reductase 4 [Nymphon striatum]|nr:Cytochrome b5 reductase 4 [Nymphon striatum]
MKKLGLELTGDLDGRPLLSSGPVRADDDDQLLVTNVKNALINLVFSGFCISLAVISTTVIVTQPHIYGEAPVQTTCPNCNNGIVTTVTRENGTFAYVIAIVTCIVLYVGCGSSKAQPEGLADPKLPYERNNDSNSQITQSPMEPNGGLSVPQFPAPNSTQRVGSARSKIALQPGFSLMDWVRLGNGGDDLTGTGGNILNVTPEELAKHNKPGDAWICLKGRVYNVSRYLDYHPGGPDELLRGVGRDATDLFNEVHRWVNFESMLRKCVVGKLVAPLKASVKGKKQVNTDSKNSLFASPIFSPPTLSKNNPSPRLDWFQNCDIISLIIYTRSKSINSSSIITNCFERRIIRSSIILASYVYIINIELSHTVLPSYEVKISSDSGAVEIMLKKENPDINWSSLGTPLAGHKSFIPLRDKDICYNKCSLIKREQVTHDTDVFTFALPEGCKMNVPIGQHVHLRAVSEGCEISRSYTAIIPNINVPSVENYEEINLMIKIYKDGLLTPFIDKLDIGQSIDISEYDGNFEEQYIHKCTHLYLLAAGTGFTPMIRLINYCLFSANDNCRHASLLFFNKTEEDILWSKELSSLQSEFSKRFHVKHVLSQAGNDWTGSCGRISKEYLKEIFISSEESNDVSNLIAICGPKGFTESTLVSKNSMGYPHAAVRCRYDLFIDGRRHFSLNSHTFALKVQPNFRFVMASARVSHYN